MGINQSHAASDYGYDNREGQDDEECNDDAVDDEQAPSGVDDSLLLELADIVLAKGL
jgi:hypothetical protein